MATDPFTLVYNALWSLLEVHEGFTVLVPVGNRIKFSGTNVDPVKDQIATADLPEVRLIPTGGVPHLQRTSNSSSCIKTFEIQVSTGDKRVDALLFPLEWEIYRAMVNWIAVLMIIEWNGKTFVKLCRPVTISEGASEGDLNRGIDGWATLWGCEVEMWFTTGDL